MPKKVFKKMTVEKHHLEKIPFFNKVPTRIKDRMFSINRRSVSLAFLFGLFFAMIPIPFQMVGVLFTSILFRHNLPISIVLVWLTNPLTMPFIFGSEYLLGAWLLNYEIIDFSFSDLSSYGVEILYSLYFGGFILGITLGLISYVTIQRYWITMVNKAKRMKKKRNEK